MKNKNLTTTLLISTYNWPQALGLVLKSVFAQSMPPGEIIIADDGSSADTKKIIDGYRPLTKIPIRHLWHKDEGFRKTIILNEAVRASTGNYIIQTDGDIILHRHFVKEHVSAAESGSFIRGSRTLINKISTEKLLKNNSAGVHFFSMGLVNRINGFHSIFLSNIFTGVSAGGYKNGVIGCNFSYWKQDFIDVNGYNNDITGWGQEDSELGARLFNNGIKKKNLKYQAICFHLHHPHYSRDRDGFNKQLLEKTIANKITNCRNGFSQHHPVTVW